MQKTRKHQNKREYWHEQIKNEILGDYVNCKILTPKQYWINFRSLSEWNFQYILTVSNRRKRGKNDIRFAEFGCSILQYQTWKPTAKFITRFWLNIRNNGCWLELFQYADMVKRGWVGRFSMILLWTKFCCYEVLPRRIRTKQYQILTTDF